VTEPFSRWPADCAIFVEQLSQRHDLQWWLSTRVGHPASHQQMTYNWYEYTSYVALKSLVFECSTCTYVNLLLALLLFILGVTVQFTCFSVHILSCISYLEQQFYNYCYNDLFLLRVLSLQFIMMLIAINSALHLMTEVCVFGN
jgi:hypothetical protein